MKHSNPFFFSLPRNPVKADWKAAWRIYRKRGFNEARYYCGGELAAIASEVMIQRETRETILERNAAARRARKSGGVSVLFVSFGFVRPV